ncbi:hypothetical protein Naga_100001g148 [Nannochloropsis gaditana]|uniref:Uncharacterized protein n=1 Tax=Nannochloropsis gaditana TaxID=72520 RepID=W7TTA3_9STRA|nr:hypothetical protein Naga_100001g148 [Nannochloropsis gaditana]
MDTKVPGWLESPQSSQPPYLLTVTCFCFPVNCSERKKIAWVRIMSRVYDKSLSQKMWLGSGVCREDGQHHLRPLLPASPVALDSIFLFL